MSSSAASSGAKTSLVPAPSSVRSASFVVTASSSSHVVLAGHVMLFARVPVVRQQIGEQSPVPLERLAQLVHRRRLAAAPAPNGVRHAVVLGELRTVDGNHL